MNYKPSVFSEMTALAQQYGALNLAQGFPEFGPPEAAVVAYQKALSVGHNQYAPSSGWPGLQDALSALDERRWGVNNAAVAHPRNEITVVPGATVGLYAIFLACIEPGDEVVVLEPSYDSYVPAILRAGGVPVFTSFEAPDWERVLSPRTRLVVVNSPHNPTGGVWERSDWRLMASKLDRFPRVQVVSDEAYEWMVFDDRLPLSVREIDELRPRAYRVLSLGKTFHATGWKIGAVVAPPEETSAFRQVYQYLAFAANTPAQVALAEALNQDPNYPFRLAAFFESKRNRLASGLQNSGWEIRPCSGSYFLNISLPVGTDDWAWARARTQDAGVATVPLTPFYPSGSVGSPGVRLCFAKSDATLDEAVERLAKWKNLNT